MEIGRDLQKSKNELQKEGDLFRFCDVAYVIVETSEAAVK